MVKKCAGRGSQSDSPLDDADRTTILVKWIATAVLAVGLLVVYIPSRETPSVGFIGLVALTAVLIMGSPSSSGGA